MKNLMTVKMRKYLFYYLPILISVAAMGQTTDSLQIMECTEEMTRSISEDKSNKMCEDSNNCEKFEEVVIKIENGGHFENEANEEEEENEIKGKEEDGKELEMQLLQPDKYLIKKVPNKICSSLNQNEDEKNQLNLKLLNINHNCNNISIPYKKSRSYNRTVIDTTKMKTPLSSSSSHFFICEICKKQFISNCLLRKHRNYSHKEKNKKYLCNVCNKEFSQTCDLNVHKRSHTGEKPYKCDICERGFTKSSTLTRHIRIHTGERPYVCNVCNIGCLSSHDLTIHMRCHTGEKPFKCKECEKVFSRSTHLSLHMRCHTNEKPFRCEICEKRFTKSNHLNRHMSLHTGIKPHVCNVCDKGFSTLCVLKRHYNNVHLKLNKKLTKNYNVDGDDDNDLFNNYDCDDNTDSNNFISVHDVLADLNSDSNIGNVNSASCSDNNENNETI
ncbi:uncharacterized protein LOC142333757 isoform X1 [Lycorma delicatula]|uniref:uncharacterized protein LOC142333757 isoform X1 n=1 Tax=Lycorma delicatula TaxID=130591 RepID=UPI003F5129F6